MPLDGRSDRTVDLDAELENLIRQQGAPHLDALRRVVGSDRFLTRHAPLGIARIETDSHGLFEFAPHGRHAVILPAYDGEEPCFETAFFDEPAQLVDLVAFFPPKPDVWWLRVGAADYLGRHRIYSANTWEKKLRVYRNPQRYLQGFGEGVCPLTRDVVALRDVPKLIYEPGEGAFAREIDRRLARPFSTPPFEVEP